MLVIRQKTLRKNDSVKVWSKAHIKAGEHNLTTMTDAQLDAAVTVQGLPV